MKKWLLSFLLSLIALPAFALESLFISQNHMSATECWSFGLYKKENRYWVSANFRTFRNDQIEHIQIEEKEAPQALVNEINHLLDTYQVQNWQSKKAPPSPYIVLDETTYTISISFDEKTHQEFGSNYIVSGKPHGLKQDLKTCFEKYLISNSKI